MLKRKILFLILVLLCGVALEGAAQKRKFTLVIDAGHGGRDAGAVGRKYKTKEKDLTLRFALAFGQMVERNCPDVNVVYTRKTDRFVELWQRAEIANKNKADLFISIHINSVSGGQARGFQTYILGKGRVSGSTRGLTENMEVARRENSVIQMEDNQALKARGYDPYSPESYIMFELLHEQHMANSVELARLMQQHVCPATQRRNGGVHQDNLAVLRLTSMPGCLLELGFISTADEENYMASKESTQQYARGIYNAFLAYKKKYYGGTGAPLPEEAAPQQAPSEPEAAPVSSTPAGKADNAANNASPEGEAAAGADPVFKVQFLTGARRLPAGSPQFKGLTGVDSYQEGKVWKFTVGSSTNYPEVYRLCQQVRKKFPEAFIIAFRGGARMDASEALQEYKRKRAK